MAKVSISRAWDESRGVLGRDGKLLATVALALLVLPGVISDMVTPAAEKGAFPDLGPWLVVAVVAFIISLVGQLAIITLALGSRATVGEAITHGLRRAPFYIAATLIWTLPIALLMYPMIRNMDAQSPSGGAALGLLALVPIFLFMFVRMILSPPVTTAETGGPLHILKRSWSLTRGNWWRLFGFFIVWAIAAAVVLLAAGALGGLLARVIFGELEPMTIGSLVVSLLTQLAGAAVTVILVVMQARLYVQLASRAEPEVTVPTSGT